MHHVDLCSGIGGFALGFEWAGLSRPVLFCDIEPWSRKILAKHWPDVPIAEDVKELALDPDGLIPDCDIITAGYPCQPFSVSGARTGFQDDRHIWPQILSIVKAKRPSWCVFENVSGHISLGLNEVLSDLESKANYAVQTFHLGAVSVDAPHRRMRAWIIAKNVAHTASKRQQGSRLHGRPQHQTQDQVGQADRADNSSQGNAQFWLPEPAVGRVANGIPSRVDRLRGLGNAIVPQIAQRIGQVIKQCEEMT